MDRRYWLGIPIAIVKQRTLLKTRPAHGALYLAFESLPLLVPQKQGAILGTFFTKARHLPNTLCLIDGDRSATLPTSPVGCGAVAPRSMEVHGLTNITNSLRPCLQIDRYRPIRRPLPTSPVGCGALAPRSRD